MATTKGNTNAGFFTTVGRGIDAAAHLLMKPEVEEREQNSDRVSGTVSINAASTDQAVVKPRTVFDPVANITDKFVSMGFGHKFAMQNPSKMIRLQTRVWSSTSLRPAEIITLQLPKEFWSTKERPAYGQSRYFGYVRCGYEFKIQVNAAAGFSGALVAYYVPAGVDEAKYEPKSILLLPHVIINLGTSSSGDLKIPYVAGSNYVATDGQDMGTVHVQVWVPLGFPTGQNTNVDVTVLGALTELDFQNPRPQAPPSLRQKVDIAEGPGVLNLATRATTCHAQTVALDAEDVLVDNTTAGAHRAFTDLIDILRVPMPWGLVEAQGFNTWHDTDAADSTLFEVDVFMSTLNPAFGLFYNAFKYWRGSIVARLTVFATPFNKGRVRMTWFPNRKGAATVANDENSLYTIMDIGLQSTVDLVIPFAWENWMRPTDKDETGAHEPIGRLAIRVLNKLLSNTNCPRNIYFTTSFSAGDDFEMFTPINREVAYQGDPKTDAVIATDDSLTAASVAGLSSMENDGGDPTGPSAAPTINVVVKKVTVPKAVHTHPDVVFGRAMYVDTVTWSSSTTLKQIDLAIPKTGRGALLRMFAYFSGSIIVHVFNESEGFVNIAHEYEVAASTPTSETLPAYLAAVGCVIIPPKTAFSMHVPFYSGLPLRQLASNWTSPFGTLVAHSPSASTSAATLSIWISLQKPSLFFPVGVPKKATATTIMETYLIRQKNMPQDVLDIYTAAINNDETDDDWEELKRRYRTVERWQPNFPLPQSSSWSRDLTMDGDVESNPGPSLVYKDRGLYKHYGVLVGDTVVHMASENILDAVSTGKVTIVTQKYDASWIVEDYDYDIVEDEVLAEIGKNYKFSSSYNCDTWARQFGETTGQDQATILAHFGAVLIMVSAVAMMQGTSMADKIKTAKDSIGRKAAAMVTNFQSFISDSMFEAINSNLIKAVAKLLVRVVCYGILFCGNPTILSTMAVAALIGMDIASLDGVGKCAKELATAMFEGDIYAMAGAFSDVIEKNSERRSSLVADAVRRLQKEFKQLADDLPTQEGIKDFNDVSLAGKNVQWWLTTFTVIVQWLKDWFVGDEVSKAREWMSSHQDTILEYMSLANEVIMNASKPGGLRSEKVQINKREALSKLMAIRAIAMKSGMTPMVASVAVLIDKLSSLGNPSNQTRPVRMEPVGIYIWGESRVGKSFFYTELITAISKELQVTPSVFMHPVSSDTYDLYNGQFFHVFDDFGQSTDENEVKHFCQIVSTPTFAVPMAWLGDKGMSYDSKVVIATSNRGDFTSFKSVTTPDALANRFTFKYNIRPTADYAINVDGKRRIDAGKVIRDNAALKGKVWEKYDGARWTPLVVADLAARVASAIKEKMDNHEMWLKSQPLLTGDAFQYETIEPAKLPEREGVQYTPMTDDELSACYSAFGPSDDCPLECLQIRMKPEPITVSTKLKQWYKDKLASAKTVWEKIKEWAPLVTVLTTVASGVAGLFTLYCVYRSKNTTEVLSFLKMNAKSERPYSGTTKVKLIGPKPKVIQEGFCPNEWTHMHRYQGCIDISGGDGFKDTTFFLGLANNQLLVYGHAIDKLRDYVGVESVLKYNGLSHVLTTFDAIKYTSDKGPIDLCLLTIPNLDFKFKDCRHLIGLPEADRPGFLLHNSDSTRSSMAVDKVKPLGLFNVGIDGQTVQHNAGVRYVAKTAVGMCGGVLIQKLKGTWKFVGMHVAGDGKTFGYSTMLVASPEAVQQGVVVSKEKLPSPIYTPTKTKLEQSPFYGLVTPVMEPAPLTARDPRIEVEMDSVVKTASDKFKIDANPDETLLEAATNIVTKKIFSVTGLTKNVSVIEAINGYEAANVIDMSTSPGFKYTSQGLTKRDLFTFVDNQWEPSDKLMRDIDTTLQALHEGKSDVVFVTCLKDELRKVERVRLGKTRSIETTGVDFTVAYRMAMSQLYSAIYASPSVQTGVAVGINPYTDYHDLWCSLGERIYGLDYAAFDGTLSSKVMRAGVEVLANLHEDPELIRKIHEPIINSTHWIQDEQWKVIGGMPSGAPCTSVLNSICNQIMVVATLLKMEEDPADLVIVCYGDDVLFSMPHAIDSAQFISIMDTEFGMDVTNVNKIKGDLELTVDEASFLKRTFALFPGTKYVVGKLDLGSMLQKIQWCHGFESFKTQFDSFLFELVFHGKQKYETVREACLDVCRSYSLCFPAFGPQRSEVFSKLFR